MRSLPPIIVRVSIFDCESPLIEIRSNANSHRVLTFFPFTSLTYIHNRIRFLDPPSCTNPRTAFTEPITDLKSRKSPSINTLHPSSLKSLFNCNILKIDSFDFRARRFQQAFTTNIIINSNILRSDLPLRYSTL